MFIIGHAQDVVTLKNNFSRLHNEGWVMLGRSVILLRPTSHGSKAMSMPKLHGLQVKNCRMQMLNSVSQPLQTRD